MTSSDRSAALRVFGVVAEGRSYKSILYCLLAFPLGVLYFVVLAVGITTGLALLIVVVGALLLYGVLWISYALANLERALGRGLMDLDLPRRLRPEATGLWAEVKSMARNPTTWLEMAHLLIKFPTGIISFVVTVSLFATGLGLLPAVVLFGQSWYDVGGGDWRIDTFGEGLIASIVGFALLILAFHVVNWMARALAWLAQALLADRSVVVSRRR